MQRNSLEFGHGSFVGAIMDDQSFFDLPVRDQARVLGWADSCPVVENLTDPENTNPGRGPEAMAQRYGQVNFWFGYINREVQARNPELYDQLMTPVQRREDEPVDEREYESVSVPDSYITEMPPMSTLAGYSLPRLFIEQIGVGKDLDKEEVQDRFVRGQAVLDHVAEVATTPNDLLALTAEGIAEQFDIAPTKVLSLVMSKGWLGEHNAQTMLDDFKRALSQHGPKLWQVYESLSDEEKAELKLA